MRREQERIAAALPGYEIGRELGRGGFGLVLSARHRALGREVAIKQLPRAFAADSILRERFGREARLLARFDHHHIVRIYDYVEADGLSLVVMEVLSGGTLWERQIDGVSMPEACALMLAAASGLQAAHEAGVLHRDVKPHNLIFSKNGVLKVTDFGLATPGTDFTKATRLTRDGEVLGTPAYMAPEQVLGHTIGPAADVYSMGMVLFELLAGRLPFEASTNPLDVARSHVDDEPMALRDVAPDTPPAVGDVVMSALARRPEDRIATAKQFSEELRRAATLAWGRSSLSSPGTAEFRRPKGSSKPAYAVAVRASDRGPVGSPGPVDDLASVRQGGYTLTEPLGPGSWKRTFRATNEHGHEVALTLLSEPLSENPCFREAFDRESGLARSTRHPHLVHVIDAGTLGARCYLSSTLVAGSSLERLLANRGPLPSRSWLSIGAALAAALQHIHDAGFIHGHVSPSQVVVGSGREVILLGSGLAATAAQPILGDAAATPFSAPEAATEPTTAMDVFSLAALLAACALGRPGGPGELVDRVPNGVVQVMTRALSSDVSQRPPTPVTLVRLLTFAARSQGP
jgi:serine/threonine protein kinase